MEGFNNNTLLPYGRLPSIEPLRILPPRGPASSAEASRKPSEDLVSISVTDPEASEAPRNEREPRADRLETAREAREQREAERDRALDLEA